MAYKHLNAGSFDIVVWGPVEGNLIGTNEGMGVWDRPEHQRHWLRFDMQADYGSHLKQDNKGFHIEFGDAMKKAVAKVVTALAQRYGGATRLDGYEANVLMPPDTTLDALTEEVSAILLVQ